MKVAIIGDGWVGKSMQRLFPDAYVYTHRNGAKKKTVNESEIAFICVPTPLEKSGRLSTEIIESILEWIETPIIVIRSTVNPGDMDNFAVKYSNTFIYQPEYLGETPNHPLLNEQDTNFIILGHDQVGHEVDQVISLYTEVYNANTKIRKVSFYEAEIIKLTENRAIAYKVMQMHELYTVCNAAGVDYYTIRDAVYGDDPRFNLWFTFIYANNLGFHSSKCLSKDVPAWCTWAESFGEFPEITKLLVRKSKEYSEQNEKL